MVSCSLIGSPVYPKGHFRAGEVSPSLGKLSGSSASNVF